jgi:hypothetical protein
MTFDDPLLRQELIDLRDSLGHDERFSGTLAGPFFGHAPATFSKAQVKIFYIGKATAGSFHEPDASKGAFGCNRGMFWSFARRLGRRTGNSENPLGNIAWSNLCKIGMVEENPSGALTLAQKDLAVRILRSEIAFLQPSLIVCTAADSPYDDFLYEALNTTRGSGDGFTPKPADMPTIWVRPRIQPAPPVLWMRHPQGKAESYLDLAEAEALLLLESDSSSEVH